MPKTIQATLQQIGPSTSEGRVRTHAVLVDRPEGKGGADRGPMGGELLLLGLGGCFMSNLLAAAAARDLPLRNAAVTVSATLDGSPERMTAFALVLRGAGVELEELRRLATIAERGCLVSNTLSPASPIEVQAEIVE